MDNKTLWEKVLSDIELVVSRAIFTTWFKGTHIVKQEEGAVYVGVPNEFTKEWLLNKHHKLILHTLRDTSEHVRSVEFVVSRNGDRREETSRNMPMRPVGVELPLQDLYINKEDNLNPRYNFETFIVGGFNELAYAAAQAVIKNVGTLYNPLFVYGKTGHGKTHLIQAIGNAIKSQHQGRKAYYITSERFVQELVNALQSKQMNQFKDRYRRYDVLIMDDIHFLSRTEKGQEEMFHLFNTLYDNNRQIVFSSDQHPNYIPGLEERLKSRFSAGMTVDIPAPDQESRLAILRSKTAALGASFSDDILNFIASSVDGNIRELEGALNSVICQTQLRGREISTNEIRDLIKNSIRPKKIVPIKDVVKIVAKFYNIDEEVIYKKTRKKEVVRPRQLIMFLLREDFAIPYPTIGQKLGGRDHTTVIHSYEKVKNDLKNNPTLEQELNQIRAMM